MPKSGLTSKAEGYGWTHQQARRRLIAQLERDGVGTCCRCGRPIYPWQARLPAHDRRGLDADHYLSRKPDAPDALACRPCNRSAGATYGNRMRGHQPRRQRPRERRTATRTPTLPEW